MLVILGFIILALVGVVAIVMAILIFIGSGIFGGVDWTPVVFYGTIGAFLLWLAGSYGPLHVTFVGG